MPVGADTLPVGADHLLVAVQGATYSQSTHYSSWSQTLICDRQVGDYVHVHASSGSGDKYGNGNGTDAVAVLATAGVVMHVDELPGYDRVPSAKIVDLSTTTSTSADGYVEGVDTGTVPDYRGPVPVAVRVLPGAVLWAATPKRDGPSAIWLADAGGVRRVGSSAASGRDPQLALSATTATWTDDTGRQSTFVQPVPGATIERINR